jgi:hypothetical protein
VCSARRRWRRARNSGCARELGASVNGISRKQQLVRACSGRAGVNGRARKHAFVRRANMQVCAWIDRVRMNGRAQGGRVAVGERV